MHNILSVISALAESTPAERVGTLSSPVRPVITISRVHGAGGEEIAERLAEAMTLPLCDKEVLREIATRMQDDPAVLQLLEGEGHLPKDMWLYRLFSGKDVGEDTYREALVSVINRMGRAGGVLVGRGAHVILKDACALRVRIVGSPDVCAHRLETQGKGTHAELLHDIRKRMEKSRAFMRDVFHSDLEDPAAFDLVVNTDRLPDFDSVVDMLQRLARAIFRRGEAAAQKA